ncbi:hypothetical protein GGU10DRAFT_359022 [Lentinula aff. detonsa]|uniref:Uncharacterized protein n=1 Tax=Lentinula aff. detonsa TaxID=2804958 RepID=A0AA38NLD9_9AGAR|nr:hypothetical protein GGU10DRAFT_359022 [Lentinula aff. detonsa]
MVLYLVLYILYSHVATSFIMFIITFSHKAQSPMLRSTQLPKLINIASLAPICTVIEPSLADLCTCTVSGIDSTRCGNPWVV